MVAMRILLILCGVLSASYVTARHQNVPHQKLSLRASTGEQSTLSHLIMKRAAIHAVDRSPEKFSGIRRFQGSTKYFQSSALLRRVARSPQAADDGNEPQDSSTGGPCQPPDDIAKLRFDRVRHNHSHSHWRHNERQNQPQNATDAPSEAN
ncbi:unnamed protein product [Hermetia illucens]|uniref:Uncharacterized protein n=1 Tax=Hermetia illucens TaxID=343691 RepID=A0A7R8Z3W5_HERIL|nr:uncharacterized protein LOC119659870 isoform X2 [Hermetia illucens]CAD7092402.1 unnamed protein product [Hermetia illucens]